MTPGVLLGKRLPVAFAERTMRLALSALRTGDQRLASSRAITAAVQAALSSVRAPSETVRRAEKVVYEARRLVQGLVIARAARLGLYWRSA